MASGILASGLDGAVIENLADRSETPLGGERACKKGRLWGDQPRRTMTPLPMPSATASPKLWDVTAPGNPLVDFAQTQPGVPNATAVAFSAASKYFALGGRDGKIHVRPRRHQELGQGCAATASPLPHIPTPTFSTGRSIRWHSDLPDPNILLAAQQRGGLLVGHRNR